jgi:1,4-dihydroxy-2-naphthoate octaprenyltransferase
VLFCSHFHQVEEDSAHGKRSPVVRLGTARSAAMIPWFIVGTLALEWWPMLTGAWPPTVFLLRQHHAQPDRISGSKFLALRFQAFNGLGLMLGLALAGHHPWG